MLPTIFELQTLSIPPPYSPIPSRSSSLTTLSAPPPYTPMDPSVIYPFTRHDDNISSPSSARQSDENPYHSACQHPSSRQHPSLRYQNNSMISQGMIPIHPTEADDYLNPPYFPPQEQATYLRALREFHLSQDPSNWGTRSPHLSIQNFSDQQINNNDYVDEIEGIRGPDELDELWTTGWRGWLAWIAEALADGVLVDPHGRVFIGPNLF